MNGSFRSPCPAHGGDRYSLSVAWSKGKILSTCHSNGCNHLDIRKSLFYLEGKKYNSLPIIIGREGGRTNPATRSSRTSEIQGVKLNIPPSLPHLWRGGREGNIIPPWHTTETRFPYFTVDGSHVEAVRTDPEDREQFEKSFHVEPKGTRGPFLPYRSGSLRFQPVLVVEGETTAQAAQERFSDYFVTTSLYGSGNADKTDWTCLRHRDVSIWPDNDEPGRKYADDVVRHARAVGARSVAVVAVPDDFPAKWDLAGEVPDGADLEDILESAETPESGDGYIRVDDFKAKEMEDTQYVVAGLLPVGGTSLIVGDPWIGKSTAVRCLADAVSTGGTWLGRECVRGEVVYLGMEEREADVQDHILKLGTPDDALLTLRIGAVFEDNPLAWLKDCQAIHEPSLIVVDTLADLFHVEDGNQYFAVKGAFRPYADLARQSGTHLCFVHHTRKSGGHGGQEIMGSAAWAAVIDTMISFKEDDNHSRWVYSKNRSGVSLPESVVEMEPESGRVTITGLKAQGAEDSLQSAVLAYVTTEAETAPERRVQHKRVVRDVKGRYTSISDALDGLVEAEKLIRHGKGGKGSPYLYEIPAGVFRGASS